MDCGGNSGSGDSGGKECQDAEEKLLKMKIEEQQQQQQRRRRRLQLNMDDGEDAAEDAVDVEDVEDEEHEDNDNTQSNCNMPFAPTMNSEEITKHQSYILTFEIMNHYRSFGEMYEYFLRKNNCSTSGEKFESSAEEKQLYEPICDEIQSKLAFIWDSTCNMEIVELLDVSEAMATFMCSLTIIPSARITEITLGILGNMAKSLSCSCYIVENFDFFIKYLFSTNDSNLQISLLRIVCNCYGQESHRKFVTNYFIDHSQQFRDYSVNFLQGKNYDLETLIVLINFLNDILYDSSKLLNRIMDESFIDGLISTFFCLRDDFTSENTQDFLILLQLLTTKQSSLSYLMYCRGRVIELIVEYLKTFGATLENLKRSEPPSLGNNFANISGVVSAVSVLQNLISDDIELLFEIDLLHVLLRLLVGFKSRPYKSPLVIRDLLRAEVQGTSTNQHVKEDMKEDTDREGRCSVAMVTPPSGPPGEIAASPASGGMNNPIDDSQASNDLPDHDLDRPGAMNHRGGGEQTIVQYKLNLAQGTIRGIIFNMFSRDEIVSMNLDKLKMFISKIVDSDELRVLIDIIGEEGISVLTRAGVSNITQTID